MENQQRGKFTEKQNKANKTNNASSKTAKAVLLWWIHSKWKHPRTKDIVNTIQKNMDKERQEVKGSIMSDFRFNQSPKEDLSKKILWPKAGFCPNQWAGWDRSQSKPFSKWNCVKVTIAFKLNCNWMHKWNVYVHSTPSYQSFEYSHKDAKLSKGLPSSNKNIHQMLLVHDSKRCNCNSFVWQSKSDYFFAFTKDSEHIQNWSVRSVMPFFNSL